MEERDESDYGLGLVPDGRHESQPLERALWRLCIKQALIDASHPVKVSKHATTIERTEASLARLDAINFFTWETCLATVKANFYAVCEYAGFDADGVRTTGLRLIASGMPFYCRL